MDKTFKILGIAALLVITLTVGVMAGSVIGGVASAQGPTGGFGGMMGGFGGMMGGWGGNTPTQGVTNTVPFGGFGGMMGGGMMGGRWGGNYGNQPTGQLSVTVAQARQNAQAYLNSALPGVTLHEDTNAFYGYYTIDVEKDGKVLGMLSINGYSGQVWYHTWHGNFLQEKELN